MKIQGTTRVAAIFGHPITHTLSPLIQNAAFRASGLDIVYVPFHVAPEMLGAAVESVRALELLGVNVTIPHKERVIDHLDEVDPTARAIGAVNTVVNRDRVLTGYNTDGEGYLASLAEETGFDPAGKRVVVIGAGGAARAIFHTLLGRGAASVLLANRTVKRAADLAEDFRSAASGTDVAISSLDPGDLAERAKEADLVVNTTSLGMEGQPPLDFPVDELPDGAVVSDIVYKPLATGLLSAAKARGLAVHGGLGMLIHQGALGFSLWTGHDAPVEAMKRAAAEALYGDNQG